MTNSLIVGVTAVAFSRNEKLVAQLKEVIQGDVIINEGLTRLAPDRLITFLCQCDCAIVGLDKITEEVLQSCQKLKIISKYGVGLDNIDFAACSRYGIRVLHTSGVNKRSVAEEVLGSSIALLRNLYVTSNLLKSGEWRVEGGRELTGKTVGIIGVGNVGKDLIALLKPFRCNVLVNDVISQSDYYEDVGVQEVSKEEIFTKSDVITLHLPLNAETRKLVNARSLSMMKSSAIVINTARGEIVDQEALKWALKNGQIAGAVLDVYETEPAQDMDLLSIPNLMCMPHIGGNSQEAVWSMGMTAINNLASALTDSY